MNLLAKILNLTTTVENENDRQPEQKTARATFAGGCFWCMEYPFDRIDGVLATTSGYTGGEVRDPTYQEVTTGETGHAEAVEVIYDPIRVSYEQLLNVFWRNIDPLVKNRQFCDVGSQYRTAIFYHSEEQRKAAKASRDEMARRFDSPIETEIVAASTFYPAEEYHQKFYRESPARYQFYRMGCGRDGRLKELWGDEADEH